MKTRNGFKIINVYRYKQEFEVVVNDSDNKSWLELDWAGFAPDEVAVYDIANLGLTKKGWCPNCELCFDITDLSEVRKLEKIAESANFSNANEPIPF